MTDEDLMGSAPGAVDPRFRWSALATAGWLLVILLVTLVGVSGIALALTWFLLVSGTLQGGFFAAMVQTVEDHLAILTVAQALIMAGMVILLTRQKGGLTRARMLGLERIGLWRLGVAVVAMLGVIFLLTEVPQMILDISDKEALKWMTRLSPVWLAFVLAVVAAPVSEELLFRGFLYGGLAQSRIGPIGAIAVTSALWALVHIQYAWPILIQIFVYGAVFGVARWRTGSLWPSLVAHALINLYAAVVAYSTFDMAA
jgi:membrane protease YdiL (CAAX protease family)